MAAMFVFLYQVIREKGKVYNGLVHIRLLWTTLNMLAWDTNVFYLCDRSTFVLVSLQIYKTFTKELNYTTG